MTRNLRSGLDPLIDFLLRNRFDRKNVLSRFQRKRSRKEGASSSSSSIKDSSISYLTTIAQKFVKQHVANVAKVDRLTYLLFQRICYIALLFKRFQRRLKRWKLIRLSMLQKGSRIVDNQESRSFRDDSNVTLPSSSLISLRNALTYLSSHAKNKKLRKSKLQIYEARLKSKPACKRAILSLIQPVFMRCFNSLKDNYHQSGLTQERKQQCDNYQRWRYGIIAIRKWKRWTNWTSRSSISKSISLNRSSYGSNVSLSVHSSKGLQTAARIMDQVKQTLALRRLQLWSQNIRFFSSLLELRLSRVVRSGRTRDRKRFIHLCNVSSSRILRIRQIYLMEENHHQHFSRISYKQDLMIGLGRSLYRLSLTSEHSNNNLTRIEDDAEVLCRSLNRFVKETPNKGRATSSYQVLTPLVQVALRKWTRLAGRNIALRTNFECLQRTETLRRLRNIWYFLKTTTTVAKKLQRALIRRYFQRFLKYRMRNHSFKVHSAITRNQRQYNYYGVKRKCFSLFQSFVLKAANEFASTMERVTKVVCRRNDFFPSLLKKLKANRINNDLYKSIAEVSLYLGSSSSSSKSYRIRKKRQENEEIARNNLIQNLNPFLSRLLAESLSESALYRHAFRRLKKRKASHLAERAQVRSFRAFLTMKAVVQWVDFAKNKLRTKLNLVRRLRLKRLTNRWKSLLVASKSRRNCLRRHLRSMRLSLRQHNITT